MRGLIGGVAPHGARRAGGRRAQAAWSSALALAAALAAAAPGAAATLREVRIGRHADYTRIVFETDAPVRYRVTRDSAGELHVRLEASASPRRVGSKSELLREVAVESEGKGSVARLALQGGEVDVREMVLQNPPRIVLDLSPRSGPATAVAERAKPRTTASEARRSEPAAAPAEAPRPATVARAEPAPLAPAPASEPAGPSPRLAESEPAGPSPRLAERAEPPRPTATTGTSPAEPPATTPGSTAIAPSRATPAAEVPAPAPEVATVRSRPEPLPVPAPEVAEAPAPPAPTAKASEAASEAREPPLELQLVAPQGTPDADDPTSARLAKAQRDLDKLAGIAPKPRERSAPAADDARIEPAPGAAVSAPDAPAVAAVADPSAVAAAGAPGPGPAAAPTAAEDVPAEDVRKPEEARKAEDARNAEDARKTEQARKEKKAKRASAPFRPVAPVAPGPLAFLPSPFDDPLVLAGIGALLALIGALGVVRRRAARMDDAFASPFDAAESIEADLVAAGGARAHASGTAAFEPASGSPVAAPTAEMGPLFASATVVADDEEASIFDVTAEEAAGENADTPSVLAPPAFEPAMTAFGAASHEPIDETELTEEEMRLIEELERRLAHMETRLEEVVDAKERLERHVAAQTEELRVQRAAIARTQRVLRTVVKPDDLATEPVAKP